MPKEIPREILEEKNQQFITEHNTVSGWSYAGLIVVVILILGAFGVIKKYGAGPLIKAPSSPQVISVDDPTEQVLGASTLQTDSQTHPTPTSTSISNSSEQILFPRGPQQQ